MKHPNIIASIILTVALLISALLICSSLHSLEEGILAKAIPTPPSFPGVVSVQIVGQVPTVVENPVVGGRYQPLVIQTNP